MLGAVLRKLLLQISTQLVKTYHELDSDTQARGNQSVSRYTNIAQIYYENGLWKDAGALEVMVQVWKAAGR